MTVRDSIIELLREVMPPGWRDMTVRPDHALRDIGIDSLALVLTVTKFLDRYEIDASAVAGTIDGVRTVEQLLSAGEELVRAAHG